MIDYSWRGPFTNAELNALHADSTPWSPNGPSTTGSGPGWSPSPPNEARAAGCEWLHVDFEDHLRPFYFGSCGFTPDQRRAHRPGRPRILTGDHAPPRRGARRAATSATPPSRDRCRGSARSAAAARRRSAGPGARAWPPPPCCRQAARYAASTSSSEVSGSAASSGPSSPLHERLHPGIVAQQVEQSPQAQVGQPVERGPVRARASRNPAVQGAPPPRRRPG